MTGEPRIPACVRAEYSEWQGEVVWQLMSELVTYRLTHPSAETRYLKLAPDERFVSLRGEATRMRWAGAHLPVPEVVASGHDDGVHWLVTRGMPGSDATRPEWRDDVPSLVRALARGLRRFHEAPVDECPFDFRLDNALQLVRRRFDEGLIVPDRDFHPEFEHLTAREAVHQLEESRPASERLVVCHGDYCLPNALLEEGCVTGFVDLGELGVADRWWDLAVATWSVTWNLGPGYEDLFLEEYGVEWDLERRDFYRLLYDLAS